MLMLILKFEDDEQGHPHTKNTHLSLDFSRSLQCRRWLESATSQPPQPGYITVKDGMKKVRSKKSNARSSSNHYARYGYIMYRWWKRIRASCEQQQEKEQHSPYPLIFYIKQNTGYKLPAKLNLRKQYRP